METIGDLEHRVGQLIREARLGRDTTQSELARASDLSLSALQNLENGRGVKLETFLRALRALDRLDIIDSLDEGYSELSPMEALRLSKNKPARPQRASRRTR
ncbi:helix-turn-helix domain-containing protein [Glutamicibacter sp. 287]|uniref:helix-turn-helix domain-containing protein n=1 Tax=unclassified Glutamicibacter TaxID=2627139 RepID=UPI0040347768